MSGAPLPFFEALNALREAGIAVDVRTHLAVGRLADRYDGTSVDELITALTSLIASDPRSTQRVREILLRSLTEPEPAPAARVAPVTRGPPRAARRRRPLRAGLLVAGLLAAVALAVAVVAWSAGLQPLPMPLPVPSVSDGHPATLTTLAVEAASCPELARPRPARTGLELGLAGGLGLVAVSVLGLAWLRRRPGPAASPVVPGGAGLRPHELAPPSRSLGRDSLHEIATILGRLDETPAFDRIDVGRSVEKTAAAAGRPVIVWARQRPRAEALVLKDVDLQGSTLSAFADELVTRLRRDGVPLDRWYLHAGDLRCARRPFAAHSVSLRSLATETHPLPLLVFADAARWTAPRHRAERDALARLLRGWSRRVWIVGASSTFAERNQLRRAVGAVFVATPRGLKAAAMSLAGRGVGKAGAADVDVDPEAVAILGGLIAIAPTRNIEMARALRAKFLPGATDALVDAVLPLIDPTRDAAERREGLARAREALTARHPELEQAARAFFLAELDRAEPAPDSDEHRRWRLQRALQLVADHDTRDEGKRQLRELGKTSLRHGHARRRGSRIEQLPELLRESVEALAAAETVRRPRTWQLGLAGGCMLLAGVVATGGTRVGTVDLPGAYSVSAAADRLVVTRVLGGAPSEIELVRSGGPPLTVQLGDDGMATLPSEAAPPGCVRAQAAFPGGTASSEDTRVVRVPVAKVAPVKTPDERVQFSATFFDEETQAPVASGYTLTSDAGVSVYGLSGAVVAVQPGEWTLSASPRGYAPLTRRLTLSSDSTSAREGVRRQRGTLEITSIPPGARRDDILVEGAKWSGKPVVLPVGTVSIKLSSVYYDDSEQTAEIRPDETTSVTVRPRNARVYGVVVLSDVPAKADILTKDATVLRRNPRGVTLRSARARAIVTLVIRGRTAARTLDVVFEPGKTRTVTIDPAAGAGNVKN